MMEAEMPSQGYFLWPNPAGFEKGASRPLAVSSMCQPAIPALRSDSGAIIPIIPYPALITTHSVTLLTKVFPSCFPFPFAGRKAR
jgi:hypothetical protein